MKLVSTDAVLTGDTFLNDGLTDGAGAIDIDLASQPLFSGITFINNFVNGASVEGGSLPGGTTTWNNPAVVYWLNSNVIVPTGSTLAIDAGQIIKLGGTSVIVQGSLQAQGTAANPVVFTSRKDDSAGGDTNNDGSASSPAVFDWGQIQFTSTSTNSAPKDANVRYGSAYVTQAFPTGGQLTIVGGAGGITGASGAPLSGSPVFATSKSGRAITPTTA